MMIYKNDPLGKKSEENLVPPKMWQQDLWAFLWRPNRHFI